MTDSETQDSCGNGRHKRSFEEMNKQPVSETDRTQTLLDSQVHGVVGKIEVGEFHPPRETYRFYDMAKCFSPGLKDKLQTLFSTYDASLRQGPFPSESTDVNDKLKTLQRRLSNDHADILYCLDNLGLRCGYEAVNVCMETVPNLVEDCRLGMETYSPCKSFLDEALNAMKEYFLQDDETTPRTRYGLEAVDMGSISPKFNKLLQVVESLCKDVQVVCLIFVEKAIAATVIERFLQKVASLSHLTVSYLSESKSSVDVATSKMQNQTPESNKSGKVHLLFTTDVAQDGIILSNCSNVIFFNLPKTVQDYVKCCERARQNDCLLIMMLERKNKKQRDQLFEIIRNKWSIYDTPKKDLDTCFSRSFNAQLGEAYVVEHTGASVTINSSLSLVHQYCKKLPGDRYYSPKPIFNLLQSGLSYECKLILPPNAAFQTIVGPPHHNSNTSKQLVCLEACKKLHHLGALDDHLLPCVDVHTKHNLEVQASGSAAGAGTTKRKELHGTTRIWSLAGSWGGKACAATYHAYKIVFSCDIDDEIYSSFILLTESRLDDDVASAKIDLYLLSNIVVPSSVFSCGQVCFNVDQIARAMDFHELFFNALYGKIFQGSKANADRRFLLQNNSELLWNPAYMYLLLPLETSNVDPESWSINWKAVNSCSSATEFMRSYWSSPGLSESDSKNFSASGNRSCSEADVLYLANTSSHVENLKNTIAFSVHTGRMYTIVDVVADLSADSPFDGNSSGAKTKYSTFTDYYFKKYGVSLLHPKQPLLLLKQSHNPFNLLVDFHSESNSSKGKTTNPFSRVHMPPELLVKIDVPVSVLKGSYLLPSVMHRMESLMLASQLRKEIAFNLTEAQIPSTLILEALTTLRCCEKFSMERLELLGDSVLKYAVGCHLFLNYPNKHEGQLSSQRSRAVCNATLHNSGTSHKIQEYIRDCAFDPRRWVAPGQLSIHPVPCSHALDTREVPSDCSRFITFEENVMVAKSCDKGHRWLGSKTISDCVEALIGAYYVGGGLLAAMHLMKWLGIEVDIELSSLDKAINGASLHCYIPKSHEIEALERKVGYEFSVKGLLLEAITHASEQESAVGYCYQRLEFLGDSVLDLLITKHLYQTYSDIDPGELTDLRSASVNNENFAQVAVRQNLYPHLQTSSEILLAQIEEYRKVILDENPDKSVLGQKGPKVLGDLIESITGAILIDTRLNLDEVWKILKPLLSPIATPDTLELPPLRELIELCDSLGYYIKENCVKKSDMIHVELKLQLKDVLLTGKGIEKTRKHARGQAASHLLKDLQKRGISYAECVSKRSKQDSPHDGDSSSIGLKVMGSNETVVKDYAEDTACKKPKTSQLPVPSSNVQNHMLPSIGVPAIGAIDMQKGGPRNTVFELCRKLQWPRPTFESTENKSRSAIELGEGSEKRMCFNTYESKISLCIPEVGIVEATGDQKADKKSSLDAAALALLYELQKQGLLNIGS